MSESAKYSNRDDVSRSRLYAVTITICVVVLIFVCVALGLYVYIVFKINNIFARECSAQVPSLPSHIDVHQDPKALARQAVPYAQMTYALFCDRPAQSWVPQGARLMTVLPDAEGFVLRMSDGAVVIAIRGTFDYADIVTDVTTRAQSVDWLPQHMRVHAGFAKRYKSMQCSILEALACESVAPGRIIVVGHSLGAAVGLLATIDISNRLSAVDLYAVLFACPKVGNRAFAHTALTLHGQQSCATIVMVANRWDVVPLMPPGMRSSFFHIVSDTHVRDEDKPDQVRVIHIDRDDGSWSANHSIDLYATELSPDLQSSVDNSGR